MAIGRSWKEKTIRLFFGSLASTTILIVVLIFLFLGKEARPFLFDHPGPGALMGSEWLPVPPGDLEADALFGIMPLLTGSLLVTFIATLIAVPFGVLGAIYLSEVACAAEREFIKPVIELLAGVPSVVLGFFGLVVLGPITRKLFDLPSGIHATTAAILLAIMAIPTILSISEDALRSVPRVFREASFALGATRFQTIWRVTVPAALSGIVAASMLGIGRVLGETMAVLMCSGNSPQITFWPFDSVRTLTATIAAEMGEIAQGEVHYQALFCIGLVLLLITLLLNMAAQAVLKKYKIG